VVVPFTISCGQCFHCSVSQYAACDNSNPAEKQDASEMMYGHPMSGLFGYSHMTGGYSGGQAEYVRVPFSDVGPLVVPDHLEDDKVLFLSDILPTGWMAAENAQIQPDDTVAVWGCSRCSRRWSWARPGSSPSITIPTVSSLPGNWAPKSSTFAKPMCARR
jgi:threonine dehydrogenase-like Zn-dependent dehydrogenase